MLDKAQGCFLGQLIGDALGSQVEFMTPGDIRKKYPDGVREMTGGGPWRTIAGQPTDDSEMAIALARTIIKKGSYDQRACRKAYKSWLNSNPFDLGLTISSSLCGIAKPESQANGALMRISPLGIFGVGRELPVLAEWAMEDAAITHQNIVCLQVNALYVVGLAHVIRTGCKSLDAFALMIQWAFDHNYQQSIISTMHLAADEPPKDYLTKAGWVLVSFHNMLWQLLHASSFAEGLIDTVMNGGDADTSGAICGAFLGAVHGLDAIPKDWVQTVLNCRPAFWKLGINHPRPKRYWPVDALVLAEKLLAL